MVPRLHDKHYSRDLKAALICSLCLFLLLFIYFPDIRVNDKIIRVPEVIFSVKDIPATIQNSPGENIEYSPPKAPAIAIKPINNRIEVLGDVKIQALPSNIYYSRDPGNDVTAKQGNNSITFSPRQIKEVLPRKPALDVKGFIKLSLMIGKDGKVKRYILLSNSTDNSECLKNVLEAVYKSRWQIAKAGGREIEYWVEKTYNFK